MTDEHEDWRIHVAKHAARGKGVTLSKDETRALAAELDRLSPICGQQERDARILAESNAEMLRTLEGVYHCIKSYEYGNASPDLAEEWAAELERVIRKAKGE